MISENVRWLTHKDLNCSENEFADFLIDCWKLMKSMDYPAKFPLHINTDIEKGESFTVTLKKEHFYHP